MRQIYHLLSANKNILRKLCSDYWC